MLGHRFNNFIARNGATPPAGFVWLIDDDGAYLTDDDGARLMEAI